MPIQPIVDKKENFTEPELILSYLIDNQMISGPDAIILLKAIIENQGKEPEPMLLQRKEKAPISIPRWGPDSTNPSPYDPIEFACECETSDNKNCLKTIIMNII